MINPFHPEDPRNRLWEEAQQAELPLQIITHNTDTEDIIPDHIYWYDSANPIDD